MSAFTDWACPICKQTERLWVPGPAKCHKTSCKETYGKMIELPDGSEVLSDVPMILVANGSMKYNLTIVRDV